MIPSSSDLSYFIEVANQLNFSRAADNLGISQPSLSLAMQRLEQAVGEKIFIRHKKGVTLTQVGKQLLVHARQLLQYWELTKLQAISAIQEVKGSFTIGCHPSVARYSLPRFLADLMTQYPHLEIKLEHDLSRKITDQVIDLNIDIAITVNPVKHPDLIIKKLYDDKITLWCGIGRRAIQDLRSDQLVLVCDPNLLQTQAILKNLKKAHINYGRLITSSSLEVVADLAESGCGVAILPKGVALSRKLKHVPDSPYYDDEICLVYRGENRDVKAIQVIAEAIRHAFKNF